MSESERAELMALADWLDAGASLAMNHRSKQQGEAAARYLRQFAAAPLGDVREALLNVRSIIAEAAMTGFNWKDGDWADRLFASQQKTSAALAALDALVPAGGVGVKPLEWIERAGVTGTFDANTSIGHYVATITDDGRGMWFIVGLTTSNYMIANIGAVRRAAQADYEQRIRSALAPQNAGGERQQSSDGGRGNQPEGCTGPHRESGETNSGATGDSIFTRSADRPSEATPAPADDIDREAYWKGAYERMASRNHELSREIDNLRGSSDPGNAGGGQAASGGGESAEKVSELAAHEIAKIVRRKA